MTNCVNCGAALHGDVCEYCGTGYNDSFETIDVSSLMGTERLIVCRNGFPSDDDFKELRHLGVLKVPCDGSVTVIG